MSVLRCLALACLLSCGADDRLADDQRGELTVASFEPRELAPGAACLRSPFGPGEVSYAFVPDGSAWRRKPEDATPWLAAVQERRPADGIHRLGWGCVVFKIPDYCSATVHTDGRVGCCCNAALRATDGGCRWTSHAGIGASPPPGC